MIPEAYVTQVAESRMMTIRHLLPVLQVKREWPEKRANVIVIGTRSEVPLSHRDPKKPILDPVKPGTMVLGHQLHDKMGIKVGDTVTFMKKAFTVSVETLRLAHGLVAADTAEQTRRMRARHAGAAQSGGSSSAKSGFER